MENIKTQIDKGKKEINFHINVDTLNENVGKYPTDLMPKEYLKSILKTDYVFIEHKSESIKSVCAEIGINNTAELKALLKTLKKKKD